MSVFQLWQVSRDTPATPGCRSPDDASGSIQQWLLLLFSCASSLSSGRPATADRHSLFCVSAWLAPQLLPARPSPACREQLGNNRFLLSDGLVIARALNRTLVEFPMQDSRIATADAELRSCGYWDCEGLCS